MDGGSEPLLPSSEQNRRDAEANEQPINVQSAIYRAPDKAVRYLTGDAVVRLGSFTVQVHIRATSSVPSKAPWPFNRAQSQ